MISIPADFIVDQAYLDRLTREANAKIRGKAITQSVGLLCHHCSRNVCIPESGSPRELQCERGHTSTVTPAQYKAERRRIALVDAEAAATASRLSAVPRYPACACGGPLMLPEQAGKDAPWHPRGHLFCAKCGPTTGATQQASPEQIDRAKAAAKAEGFEVKS